MINYVDLEQQNKNIKEQEVLPPTIEFESYVPDDLLHAPAPDMWYRYSVTNPFTGEYIIDPETNLLATDFIAYSVEYEGEYYWTYNVYLEEAEGIAPDEGAEDLINKYSPVNTKVFFPQSMGEYWDINIESVERNLISGDINLGMTIQTTYPTLVIDDYNIDTGEYTVKESPSYNLDLDENIYVYANGTEILEQKLLSPYLFYEVINSFPPEINFIEERKGVYEFELDIDYSLIENDELELEIVSRKTVESLPTSTEDHLIADSVNQIDRYVIPTNQDSIYNVSFNGTSMNKTISIPYYWEGEEKKWESFTFNKLFDNYYKYPTATKDLLEVSYSDGITNVFPDNEIESMLKIKIDNYPIDEVQVKKRYEGNKVIFYVDEDMYYDYENEIIMDGTSDDKFTNEKGLILPWDDTLSGEIEFTFTAETYKEYTFNVSLKIGNTNKLRGDNGKYEIEEV